MAYNASSRKIKPVKPPKIEVSNLKTEDVKRYNSRLINAFMQVFVSVLASSNFNLKNILLSEFTVLLKNYKVATSEDISSISSLISYTEDNILTSLDYISQLIEFRNNDYDELINSIKEGFDELKNGNSENILKDQFNELNTNNPELHNSILKDSSDPSTSTDETTVEDMLDYNSFNTLIASSNKKLLADISSLINDSTTTICNSIKNTSLLSTTFEKFDTANLSKTNTILSSNTFKKSNKNTPNNDTSNDSDNIISNISNEEHSDKRKPPTIKSLKSNILAVLTKTKRIIEIIQLSNKFITKYFNKILYTLNSNFKTIKKSLKFIKNQVIIASYNGNDILKYKDYINPTNINKYSKKLKDALLPEIDESIKRNVKGSASSRMKMFFGIVTGILSFILNFIIGALGLLINAAIGIILGGISLVKWVINFIIECLKNPVVQVFLAVAVAYIKVRYYEPIMKAFNTVKKWFEFYVAPVKQEMHALLLFVRNIFLIGLPKAKILLKAYLLRHFPILLDLWSNTTAMIKNAIISHILSPIAAWMAIEFYGKHLQPIITTLINSILNHPMMKIVKGIGWAVERLVVGTTWAIGSFFNTGSRLGTALVATYDHITSSDSQSWMDRYDKLSESAPHTWVDNNILLPMAQNPIFTLDEVFGDVDISHKLPNAKNLELSAKLWGAKAEAEYNELYNKNIDLLGQAKSIQEDLLALQNKIDSNPDVFRAMSDEDFKAMVDRHFDIGLNLDEALSKANLNMTNTINSLSSTLPSTDQYNTIDEKLNNINSELSSINKNVKKLNKSNNNQNITNNTIITDDLYGRLGALSEKYEGPRLYTGIV